MAAMQRSIFRKVALERLSSPEQLDQLLRVTDRRGWLALSGAAMLLVMAVLWGVLGSVSSKISGDGLLMRRGGLRTVVSRASGEVMDLHVRVGDVIDQGQVVATLFQAEAEPASRQRYVASPNTGRVLEVMTDVGDFVREGTRLVNLEPIDEPLEVVLYVSSADGKRVRPGMPVEISPATVRPEEHGFLRGRVRSTSAFPVSREGMTRVVGTAELATQFSSTGQPYEILVDLEPDPESFSGFRWSSRGPDATIEAGTMCSAKIVIEQERPIALVIPRIKKTLGLY